MSNEVQRVNEVVKVVENDVMKIFQNNDFGEIRVVGINNEPYFVAKDIADILGYSDTNKMTTRLDEDEKLNRQISGLGQPREMTIISESGLYNAVLGSQKPEAKKFKKWITSEVIPSIRKTGGYVSDEDMFINLYLPDAPDEIKEKFKATTAIIKGMNQEIKQLNGKIIEDKPKVTFANSIEKSTTGIMVGDMAKIIKQSGIEIGQHRLFRWLRDEGLCVKRGNSQNMPTQYAMNLELMMIEETVGHNKAGSIVITKTPKVTGKGQIYILNRFTEWYEKQTGEKTNE